jgi:hypothetical protein
MSGEKHEEQEHECRRYDHREIFQEQIYPELKRISELCEKNNINFVWAFDVMNEGDSQGTLVATHYGWSPCGASIALAEAASAIEKCENGSGQEPVYLDH